MTLKNIISVFALLTVVLIIIPSVCGYTFGGRGALHTMETSDYVLHPEKDKTMTLEDLQKTIAEQENSYASNSLLSPEEEMLFPEEKIINMHDFAGHGSLYGYPHTGLHAIGPHLHKTDIDTTPYGGWGEPTSVGACGHFYGLGTI